MDLKEAWSNLGFQFNSIIMELKSTPLESRMVKVDEVLTSARKSSKQLLAKHHPDMGGDVNEFKKVNESISLIETETSKLKIDLAKKIEENAYKKSKKTIIEMK